MSEQPTFCTERALVEHLFRHEAGRIVAALTRMLGPHRLDLAEDVTQETLLKALHMWSFHGVPENPSAWLMQVAKNAALDIVRRERTLDMKVEALTRQTSDLEQAPFESDAFAEALDHALWDDQLRMIFMCCHPLLSRETQVALTLKTLGGFGVQEIARAFLSSEPAIARRLERARRTIRERGLPFVAPEAAELPARLDAVHATLYLIFNEGYSATQGEDVARHELCAEAIRLTRLLTRHPIGDCPATHALLALMLLQASRLPARLDAQGEIALLEDQDRTHWDRHLLAEGFHELERSMGGDALSVYHLQAAIASCHAAAPSYAETNWERILHYYDQLIALTPSPIVALNRAVALTMAQGPAKGLAELDRVATQPGIQAYHVFHAARADTLCRLGDLNGAAASYRCALGCTTHAPERRFFERRLRECQDRSA